VVDLELLAAMPGLTRNDRKGLWAILWRTLIFAPILWILGLLLFTLVLGAFIVPPIYAVLAFFAGDWLWGITALIVWFVLLCFRRPILRWTFEGIEHAAM
jgi:hypothetical protein